MIGVLGRLIAYAEWWLEHRVDISRAVGVTVIWTSTLAGCQSREYRGRHM